MSSDTSGSFAATAFSCLFYLVLKIPPTSSSLSPDALPPSPHSCLLILKHSTALSTIDTVRPSLADLILFAFSSQETSLQQPASLITSGTSHCSKLSHSSFSSYALPAFNTIPFLSR